VCVSDDGHSVLSVSQDSHLRVYNLRESKQLRDLSLGHLALSSLACVDRSLSNVFVGSWDNRIYSCDLKQGTTAKLAAHDDAISCLHYGTHSQQLLSGSWDTTAKLWAIHSGSLHADAVVVYENGESEVNAVSLANDGASVQSPGGGSNVEALMAVGMADGRVVCVDQRSGRCVSQFRAHDEAVVNVILSAQGALLSADRGGHWRRQTVDGVVLSEGQCERELGSMLSDGNQLLLGRSDGIVELWDVLSGKRVLPLTGKHTGPCVCMDLAPGAAGGGEGALGGGARGATLLTGGVDGFVRTWRSKSG